MKIVWLMMVALFVSSAALAAPKPTKIPKPPKESKSWGKKIEKTINRQGGGNVTYPGILVHYRRGSKTQVAAWLADCSEEQICLLNSGVGCYLDEDWLFLSPNTFGMQILEKSCKDDDRSED